jgi:hypothetical protein
VYRGFSSFMFVCIFCTCIPYCVLDYTELHVEKFGQDYPRFECWFRHWIRFVSPSTSLPLPSSISVQFSRSLPLPLTLANAPELDRALLMGSLRDPPAPAPLVGRVRVLRGSGLHFASARVLKPRDARLLDYILLQLLPATGS